MPLPYHSVAAQRSQNARRIRLIALVVGAGCLFLLTRSMKAPPSYGGLTDTDSVAMENMPASAEVIAESVPAADPLTLPEDAPVLDRPADGSESFGEVDPVAGEAAAEMEIDREAETPAPTTTPVPSPSPGPVDAEPSTEPSTEPSPEATEEDSEATTEPTDDDSTTQ